MDRPLQVLEAHMKIDKIAEKMAEKTTVTAVETAFSGVPTGAAFELVRDAFGRLILTNADGLVFEQVSPVRSFPIQDPEHGIAMVSTDGREVAWIDDLQLLPVTQRALIIDELAAREFVPAILRIIAVTSYATPSTWTVLTDRGETTLVLRGEEDIRRIHPDTLLVSDIHGIQFLIRNLPDLDKHSKKILDRFL
jgi:hypothetical protein